MAKSCKIGFADDEPIPPTYSLDAGTLLVDRIATALGIGLGTNLLSSLGFSTGVDSQTALDLLREMANDNNSEVGSRVRTQFERCAQPNANFFGKGSVPTKRFCERWNGNGETLLSRVETLRQKWSHIYQSQDAKLALQVFDEWAEKIFDLYDCFEGPIEENTFCKGPKPERERVPAMVEKCIQYAPISEDQ